MFNGTKAVGVAAMTAGTYGTPSVTFNITANKEVIISAGALQSPQLLMVSGIGNCSELAVFDIPCRIDLPGVGKNMWEYVYLQMEPCRRLRH
jgi:choline dehydrogenase